MVRLLSIGIECLSSAVFLIPAVFLLQYVLFKQHSFYRAVMVFLFACYLMAVFSVVGIPAVQTIRVDFNFNFIPLVDIVNSPAEYIKNTLLNIILFMPMGFLLPVLWEEYRPVKKTVFMGLAVSIIIEALQIFTFRLTDVDDLITNTLGTFLGYHIGKMLSFKLPWKMPVTAKMTAIKNIPVNNDSVNNIPAKYEAVILLTTVFLIAFFLKTFVSNAVWNIVLSGSLWERLK